MTDASVETSGADAPAAKAKGKKPLVLGIILAVLGGAGGFYAVSSGLLFSDAAPEDAEEGDFLPAMYEDGETENVRFVRLAPIVVSLGPESRAKNLRFTAAIETVAGAEDEVAALEPRILDVMNSYLRALEPGDIDAPDGLFLVRAQLTRRLQLVLGEDRMRDLLVMEFVLN